MTNKILYLDIDGVLADFDGAVEQLCPGINTLQKRADPDQHKNAVLEICRCNPSIFENLIPLAGVLEAVDRLLPLFDVYFLSSPMWYLPASFIGKRLWLEKHIGEKGVRRLILTHRKDLCLGDFLVDDRLLNGAAAFRGEYIHFGSPQFPDWSVVMPYLIEKV